ncbi:MAG TPA: condensation domain-containing protein, partial [Streptosporangiaceae bacterium]|nr:condensation domain-containing protein [Streptosporangiaceae bacterium]
MLPAQRGMILNYMRFCDDGVDIQQCTLDWTDPLEREPFEAAWRTIVRRHSILRTAFRRSDGDRLIQVVGQDAHASIDIRWLDLPPLPDGGHDLPFESFLLDDRRERFDLARQPPVRLTILRRVNPGETDAPAYRAVLTYHHALLDGRSLPLLIDEVSAAYAASRDGRDEPDPPRPPFLDFVRWWYMTDDPSASER